MRPDLAPALLASPTVAEVAAVLDDAEIVVVIGVTRHSTVVVAIVAGDRDHPARTARRSDAAKNIYVREDVLLRELAMRMLPDRTAAAEDGVAAGDVAGVADSLRAAGIIIRHDGRGWDLTTA